MGDGSSIHFTQQAPPAEVGEMKQRIANEIKTTFTINYKRVISFTELRRPDIISEYARRAIGEKFVLNPNRV
ncbi:hypothetical protein BS639_17480 [Rouxiella silvae]|jgi:hypothetical protein|uniref:Uncharacterized protein n=2 Tax=Rouxiella silvae TaxID=1646373 RepID=A0ABX3TY25_9GAMM|nr:hypothetical protein BS639_17480 [Rouxiella silvae]